MVTFVLSYSPPAKYNLEIKPRTSGLNDNLSILNLINLSTEVLLAAIAQGQTKISF